MGKYDEALSELNKSLELDPEYKEAYITRANLYAKLAELSEDTKKNEYLERASVDLKRSE